MGQLIFVKPSYSLVKSVNGMVGDVVVEIPGPGEDGYATEEYVAKKIAEAQLAEGEVDLSAYYTKSETNTEIDKAIATIPEVDLTDYAKKSEIPSTTGLATESYVDEKFNSVDIDLTGYATEEYVNQKIDEAQLSGEGGNIDLTDYATKDFVEDFVSEEIANIQLTPGPKGEDGYTPVKGVDYFDGKDGNDYVLTYADKQEIASMVEVTGGDDGIYVGETEPTDNSLIWINPNGEASVGFATMADVNAAIAEALNGIKTAEEGAY